VAERLRELLLVAGIIDPACAPTRQDASFQVSRDDEDQGLGFWASPVPLAWRPCLSAFPPMPASLLGRRQIRALMWAIYVDRVATEPGCGPISVGASGGAHHGASPAGGAGGADAAEEAVERVQRLRGAKRAPHEMPFADFVLEWLRDAYSGGRAHAMSLLSAMVSAMRKYASEDARVRTFARFCGASLEGHDLDGAALRFYMRSVHLLFTTRAGLVSFFTQDSSVLVSLERAHALAAELFGSSPGAERLRKELTSRSEASKRGGLDMDDLLLLLVGEYQENAAEQAAVRQASSGGSGGSGGSGVVVVGGSVPRGLSRHDGTRDLLGTAPAAQPLRRVAANLFSLFWAADRTGRGSLTFGEVEALVLDQQRRTPSYWREVLAQLQGLVGPRGPVDPVSFFEACAGRGFREDRASTPMDLEAQWTFRQAGLALQLSQLRAYVAETGGNGDALARRPVRSSSQFLVRAVAAAQALAKAMQHGFDEALARVELMALEDALRRGGVAIELERAGGGLAVAGRADELRESPKYSFHDSVQ
jgi:hypothetical protein